MSFESKYLKYKNKYNLLKYQNGGMSQTGGTRPDIIITNLQTILKSKDDIKFKELKSMFPPDNEDGKWEKLVNMSQNEPYKIYGNKTAIINRFAILAKNLYNFCNAKISDISNDTYKDADTDKLLNEKNEKLISEVKKLFKNINDDIDTDLGLQLTIPTSDDEWHFVIGTSQLSKDKLPESVADTLAYHLSDQARNRVITFGSKCSTSPYHVRFNLIDPCEVYIDAYNIFDTLIEKFNISDKVLNIYFTFGSHTAMENITSVNYFEEIFNKSKHLKRMRLNGQLRIIVTGTDAILPSDSTTFYKMGTNQIAYAYGFTKLYQIVKCAHLVMDSEVTGKMLVDLNQLLKDGNNIPLNLYKNDLNLVKYNNLVKAILPKLEELKYFDWVRNLSVLLTNMHVYRLIDYSNPKIPFHTELSENRARGEINRIQAVKNIMTNNVFFRGKNMITPKQAVFEHFKALSEIKNKCAPAESRSATESRSVAAESKSADAESRSADADSRSADADSRKYYKRYS